MEHSVFEPKIWCIWCIRNISLIAKRKKHLQRSVIFSKVSSCKPTSLLQLALHTSTKTHSPLFQFLRFSIYETFLKDGSPGSLIFQPPQPQFLISKRIQCKKTYALFSSLCLPPFLKLVWYLCLVELQSHGRFWKFVKITKYIDNIIDV